MLCVEAKALPTLPKVRKDIDVQRVLTENVKFFNDKESALTEGFIPVDFAISTRSIYTNTVLAYQHGEHTQYYRRMTNIGPVLPHRGLDLFMYVSSLSFLESVLYTQVVDDIMLHYSQFQPIGLYFPDEASTPIFYAHLLLSDVGMQFIEPHLKPGVTIAPIRTMTPEGNIPALLETLIIVKEEHHE